MSGAESVGSRLSAVPRYLCLSLGWDGEPVIPPFLYLPGAGLLAIIVSYLLLGYPAYWGWRYLGVLEVYTLGASSRLLVLQGEERNTAGTVHEYWRIRTVLWGLVALAFTGLVLTVFYGYPSVPRSLVPESQFPTTEIAALLFTIAILAILARYTAMTSRADTSGVASGLRDVVETLRLGFANVSREIAEYTQMVRSKAEVDRALQEGRVTVRAHVEKSGWLHHSARIDIKAGPLGFDECDVTITQAHVSGGPGTHLLEEHLGARPANTGKTFDLGDVSHLYSSAIVTLEATWKAVSGTRYRGVTVFRYTRTGLFGFRFDPDFSVEIRGDVVRQ